MLKEFVFVIIIISAYLTWHSTILFQKTETWETNGKEDLSSDALLAADKINDKVNDKVNNVFFWMISKVIFHWATT